MMEFPAPASERDGGRWPRVGSLFTAAVVVPTLVAAAYYAFFSADRYVSESRFLVRNPHPPQATTLIGGLLESTGFSRSLEDTYVVQNYILSRDALAELEENLAVGAAFRKGGRDFLNRFPGLEWEDTFESLYRYYKARVSVTTDTASSVTVLTVSAFTAEDAYRINERLLVMSERLVNQLNRRAREDTMAHAESETQAAEARARAAAQALAAYRNRVSVIDLERQAALQLQEIAKLGDALFSARTLLSQVEALAPRNPQVSALRLRVRDLEREIAAESAKVTGAGGSLASKATEFERLTLEQEYARKQLEAALLALESARDHAQRQMLYLDRVVRPNLPATPIEPRRVRGFLVVVIFSLMLWAMLSLLIYSVREHRS
ncbi:MAG: hypothetical protein K1Y01_19325 [Vicinamibacteria bacterium]|nr:hypothetical protein [Vicinamibacteria bacterium]